eukprot:6190649-Pleurochrysis_carterae.AAC.2
MPAPGVRALAAASSVSTVSGHSPISVGACTSAVGVVHSSTASVSCRSQGKSASTNRSSWSLHMLSPVRSAQSQGLVPQPSGNRQSLGQMTFARTPTSMPGAASVNMERKTTMVESSVHAQSGCAKAVPCKRATVASSRTAAHGETPFIPPRFVGCESKRSVSDVASGGKDASTRAGR